MKYQVKLPSTFHGSCLPLIGLILIVSICYTDVKGQLYRNKCAVPQGSQAVLCFGFDEENLTSSDLPSHVGDTVFGKCIVSKDDIVNDVYITIDPKPCASHKPSRLIRKSIENIKKVVIDERSVTFKLVNVSKYDEGFYQCRDSSSDRLLANAYLYAGRTPLKPYVSHKNIMISNWQNVSMTLSPSYHQQKSHIGECVIFNLMWSIKYSLSRSTAFLDCGTEHSMMCSFALDDFQPNMTLFLEVTLKNKMDRTVTILEIDALDDRVKPASPSNLQVSNGSSTSLDISWESPNEDFAVLYMIGLTASNVEHKLLRNVTNITQIKLSGLIPHGIYTISISAKPLYYGLVSDEVNILHEMKPDVPGRNPMLVPGGFDATSCGRNCRNVTIYWKPIPEQFSNGAIDYIVMLNGIYQTVDGNRSHHALTASAKDSPTTVYLFATNKDARIGRNHSLPGTRLDVPADGKISLVSSVTYKEKNETHRLMTWVLNNADVLVSVVQCRESGDGECEEETPLGSTVTSPGQTSAVTSKEFRTGIGITKHGKEMGIFWSEPAQERVSVSPMNDNLILILIVVGLVTLITCIVIVGAIIFRQRSKRPVKMKTPKSPNGWVQSNDTEVFIGDAPPVVHEVTHVPPTLEEDDSWTTPQEDSCNSNDDISSNSTESDELNDSYYHCNHKNCLFVEASDPGPIPNKALSSEADDVNKSCKVGRGVLKRQPGDEDEVYVANRRKVDTKSVSAEKGTIPSLNMEDKDNNMAAVPVDGCGCECARQVGEGRGPGRCKDIELRDIEPEKMSEAERDGTDDSGGLDPHTLETCLNQDNNSSCNNQAIPHALSATTISNPGTVEYHHDYSKVSFAKDLYK